MTLGELRATITTERSGEEVAALPVVVHTESVAHILLLGVSAGMSHTTLVGIVTCQVVPEVAGKSLTVRCSREVVIGGLVP